MKAILTALILIMTWADASLGSAFPAGGKTGASFFQLTTSNGHAAAIYTIDDAGEYVGCIDHFYPHIYRFESENRETPDLCYDTFFGVRSGGLQSWCNTIDEELVEYINGTGIIHTRRFYRELQIDTYHFCPFNRTGDHDYFPVLVALTRITNVSAGQLSDCAIFQLFNFHIGDGAPHPGNDYESIDYIPAVSGFSETSADSDMEAVYLAVETPDIHTTSTDNPADNPWTRVNEGNSLINRDSIGTGEDRVCAFQWNIDLLNPGESFYAGSLLAGGDIPDNLHSEMFNWIDGQTPQQLLEDEIAWWEDWHAVEPELQAETDYRELFRQSTAFLKMGQCREANVHPATTYGQIPASLPPGQWAITWVRDGAYAAAALARTGHFQECEDYFSFLVNAETGSYRSFTYNDEEFGIQVPYGPSVCRYFGNGTEESDGGSDPNIEFDNFGLTLWAVREYQDAGGDMEFIRDNWDFISRLTAYPLVRNLAADGLMKPDSSCWERHLSEAEQYSYSSILASAGFRFVSEMAGMLGYKSEAEQYRQHAENLLYSILTRLNNSDNVLQGAAGSENSDYLDAAVIEALNLFLIHPEGIHADQTLDDYESQLRVFGQERGYKRLTGRTEAPDDWYDRQEWGIIDLRTASAHTLCGNEELAGNLMDWIKNSAADNFNIIPELYKEDSGDYEGAIPMIGFGAGAYVLAALDRFNPQEQTGIQ